MTFGLGINLGIGIGCGNGGGGGGSSTMTLAIAARGQMPITMLGGISSNRTQLKSRLKFLVWTAATEIALVYGNKAIDLTTGELANANSVTIRKVAIEKNGGSFTPITFGGSRSYTLAPGEYDKVSDFATFSVSPGDTLWVRSEADVANLASGAYPIGKLYRDSFNEAIGIENSYSYLPANEIDDIDGTGALAVPTGATAGNQNAFAPVLIIGKVANGSKAVIGFGDSIADGDDDLPSADGSFGGAFLRRAAYNSSLPYTSCARSAMRADVLAGQTSTMMQSLIKYHTDMVVSIGSNDIAGLRTAAQILGDVNTIFGWGSQLVGRKRKIGCSIIQRVATFDLCTTLANQTPATGHNTGEVRDQFNTALAAQVGAQIDKYANTKATVDATASGEPNKWALDTFSTTLAADALTSATTASLTSAPRVEPAILGTFIVLEPGTANASATTNARVLNLSGSGPYTINIGATWLGTSTHLAGSAVGASPAAGSSPGVHPEGPGNAAMAVPVAAAFV